MFDAKLMNSILHVNNNNFTDPLTIGAFEKRAAGFESHSGDLQDFFSGLSYRVQILGHACK